MQCRPKSLSGWTLYFSASALQMTVLVAISLCVFGGAFAAGTTPPVVGADAWVHGSFVNLRQAARNDAAIVDQWPTNTRAKLLDRKGDWCEVENTQQRRGFMQCRFLGAIALTLVDLKDVPASEAPRRAFWIEPSWESLVSSGEALTASLLSEKQRETEMQTHKPVRWVVPEFEAMKARLRAGVPPRAAPQEMAGSVPAPPGDALVGLPVGALPKISKSFFKLPIDFSIAPTIETAATMFGSTVKLQRILRGAQFQQTSYDEWIDGAWDIGEAELSFEPPLVAYAVTSNGMVAAKSIPRAVVSLGPDRTACGGVDMTHRMTSWQPRLEKNIEGYARFANDQRVLEFYSRLAVRPENVKVTTRQWGPATLPEQERGLNTAKLVVHAIDLNNDKVVDLVIMVRKFRGQISAFLSRTQVFVNIGGDWSQEFDVTEDDCT